MVVGTTAGVFEKPMINTFHRWGGTPWSWWGTISKSMSLPLWSSTLVSPTSVERGIRERFAWLQIQAAKDEQDFKNNLHKSFAGKANGLTGSGLNREGDWTTHPELPRTVLCAPQADLLLSRLTQILPSWQRKKVVHFFSLQDTALYKCWQMNPDKVIYQFNRMKALCTKRWCEIIA